MSLIKNPFDVPFERLPETLPVFPLDSAIILPGGQIPLHIFEQRYLHMVQDTLAANDRLMGVCMPKESLPHGKKRALHDIGCAGRITSFEETSDGRFLITLTGYCRFKVKQEIPCMRGYRKFEVDWKPFQSDLSISAHTAVNHSVFIDKLKEYAQLMQIDMDWRVLSETPIFSVVTFFSMSLPFSNTQKQQLLEAEDTYNRMVLLTNMIDQEILKHRPLIEPSDE